jgi:hypothetical protein
VSDPAVRGRIIATLLLSIGAAIPCLAKPRPLSLIGAESPEWSWRQILASPRIGGRLTAVAVDPKNPDRIFVGTEEGNLVRSIDGGITWDERTLTPFLVQARSVGVRRILPPALDDATSASFTILGDPPDRIYADDAAPPFGDNLGFSLLLGGLYGSGVTPYVGTGNLDSSLLFDVVESRREETVPVRRIAVCPGFEFPLLVATTREVFGSADDGVTSIRLFFMPDDGEISHVACSPYRRGELAVATTTGLYRSTDGGLTFNTVPGGSGSTAIAFAKEPTHNVEILYSAFDASLYGGDPESIFGLQYLYPPDEDAETVPWEEIRWIEAPKSGEIWLATDDGLRLSRGHGERFRTVEPTLFGHQEIKQVLVDEGERIAVLLRDQIYASDDEGITWHPFFFGITKRTFRQMAVGPRVGGASQWWVVTSGELWTNVGPAHAKKLAETAWAKAMLENTPTLSATIENVLERTRLSNSRINALTSAEKARVWIPYVDIKLTVSKDELDRVSEITGGEARRFDEDTARNIFQIFVQATWSFYETRVLTQESGTTVSALYELRKQVAFAAEDAWNERALHLARVVRGEVAADQAEVLRVRVETLESVLDQWGWRDVAAQEEE